MKTIKILRGLGLALLFLLLLHLAVRTLGFAMYSVLERHKAEDKVGTGDFASACFAMTPRNSVDMVLIGSSHQYCSVDVTMLNREYGFNSILLASSGQDLELNYYAAMAAIELLVAIKDEFGVSIAPTELDREEMNTVNKIIARVKERL